MIVKLSKDKTKYFDSLKNNFAVDYLKETEVNPFYNCILYVDKGEVVGYLAYNYLYDRYDIVNFETLISYRGVGVGRKLMIYFVSLGKEENIKNITLEVNKENPVVEFYKKNGFVEKAIRAGYYNGVDGILMEKEMI